MMVIAQFIVRQHAINRAAKTSAGNFAINSPWSALQSAHIRCNGNISLIQFFAGDLDALKIFNRHKIPAIDMFFKTGLFFPSQQISRFHCQISSDTSAASMICFFF